MVRLSEKGSGATRCVLCAEYRTRKPETGDVCMLRAFLRTCRWLSIIVVATILALAMHFIRINSREAERRAQCHCLLHSCKRRNRHKGSISRSRADIVHSSMGKGNKGRQGQGCKSTASSVSETFFFPFSSPSAHLPLKPLRYTSVLGPGCLGGT